MSTIDVKDAAGTTVPIEKPLAPGRGAAAASRPVVLSTEDKAALDLIATAAGQALALTQETAVNTVLGIKADAKSASTDTTPVSAMSVWKQISASVQSLVTGAVLAAGSALIGKVDHSSTGLSHGHKESTTIGTAVALAGSTAAKWVTIQAYRSNVGYVSIGATGVVASLTAGTGTGLNLAAGESVTFPIDNLADVFIDVTVSGEGVRYTYGT